MSTVITVENLGKKYFLKHQSRVDSCASLRDVLSQGMRNAGNRILRKGYDLPSGQNQEEFWALKDICFAVEQGDRVGVIGRNGAGKSTLLKILSRITEPTTGSVRIKGRVASLLEVGTGFHPELTGRENIFLNGAILGMGRTEIKRKFDEIVDFAETEKFLDTPVKRYSSGMYVRLAFAVAAHLEPEILVVDEVLAVGDAQFQKKCLGKMRDASQEGRTVIFVSHSMGAIHSLTRKCVYLEKGELLCYSDSPSAVQRYLADASCPDSPDRAHNLDFFRPDYVLKAHGQERKVRYTRIWVEQGGQQTEILEMGLSFTVFFELEAGSHLSGANLSMAVLNADFQPVTVIFSWDRGFYLDMLPGKHVVRLEVTGLSLTPGKYHIGTGINQSTESVAWDSIQNLPLFEVRNGGMVVHWLHRQWGCVHCDSVTWRMEPGSQSEAIHGAT
jgi:lipopolysaccharide transport system ATP-binding protein